MKRKLGFIIMIFAMISLASCESKGKKITCKPENLKEKISDLKEGTYNVIVTGTISNSKTFLNNLAASLKQDRSVKIYLDLSETEGLKTFYSGASNLLGVSLPPSVKNLDYNSFRGKNTKYVDFPKGNKTFTVENKNAVYLNNPKTLIAVLQTVEELNVSEETKVIGFFATYKIESLEKVTLPSTLTELRSSIFEDCPNLNSVAGKIKVKEISGSFSNCPKLTFVDFEGSQIKTIETSFIKLPNVQVKLPETVEKINNSFKYSEIAEIKLPGKVQFIKDSFDNLGITDIELSDSVEVIENCFNECSNLKQIHFGNNLKILMGGFESCPQLKTISLPASLLRLSKDKEEAVWEYNIELKDTSSWLYMTSKRVKGEIWDEYSKFYENNIEQEVLSSPEKLGNFVNNLKSVDGWKSEDGDYCSVNGIWKKGYDVYKERWRSIRTLFDLLNESK